MGDEDARWWDCLDAVIRGWLHDDQVSVDAWETFEATDNFRPLQELANRGHVTESDPARTAAWEAFLYQRSHIEAVKVVVGRSMPLAAGRTQRGSLGIVDWLRSRDRRVRPRRATREPSRSSLHRARSSRHQR